MLCAISSVVVMSVGEVERGLESCKWEEGRHVNQGLETVEFGSTKRVDDRQLVVD